MAIPPWSVDLLRRGIDKVARTASDPEILEKVKSQAAEILQDLPDAASRGFNAVLRTAEAGKRSVERWVNQSTPIDVPVLNATGVLMQDIGAGVSVAAEVIEAGQPFIAGNAVSGHAVTEKLYEQLSSWVPDQSNYGIAVASSFPAALTAFSQLVLEMPLVVHRHNAVRLPGGIPLPDAFGTLLPVIQEIGSVDAIAESDFDSLEQCCSIVGDNGVSEPKLLSFAGPKIKQAIVLPVGSIHNIVDSFPSAQQWINAGADAVLLPGGGLSGGPECGLILAKKSILNVVMNAAAWPSLQANHATLAMMSETLRLSRSASEQLPIVALIRTAEENLRARAERMAIRLTGSDEIATCQVCDQDARLTEEGRWTIASRQLKLTHKHLSVEAWAAKLAESAPLVAVGQQEDGVTVDLRWVPAADDHKLSQILGGEDS